MRFHPHSVWISCKMHWNDVPLPNNVMVIIRWDQAVTKLLGNYFFLVMAKPMNFSNFIFMQLMSKQNGVSWTDSNLPYIIMKVLRIKRRKQNPHLNHSGGEQSKSAVLWLSHNLFPGSGFRLWTQAHLKAFMWKVKAIRLCQAGRYDPPSCLM